MPQKQTDFNKSLAICILALLGVIVIGGIASRQLEKDSIVFNEIIDISGEQRMLSQRIALEATQILQTKNNEDYNTYKDQLNTAVQRIINISKRLKSQDLKNPKLNKIIKKFNGLPHKDGYTKGQIIDLFIKDSLDINLYFQDRPYINENIPPRIQDEVQELLELSDRDILGTYDQKTELYRAFSQDDHDRRLVIKLFFVIFFTAFIFFIVMVSFYPMHKKMKNLLNAMDRQKEHFETERNRLYLASQATVTGIWDWDIKSGGLYWNDVLKEILGLQNEQGNTYDVDFFQSLLHLDDKGNFNEAMQKHLKDRKFFFFEGRTKHNDGHYIWISYRGQTMWNENDIAYRMIGTIQDFTSVKEVEIQRDIFIQGIEAANIAFAIINLKTEAKNFTYASPAFCTLTSYDFEKITHSNMGVFTGSETSMGDLDRIDYALKNKENLSLKMLSYRYDGSSYHNQIILRPIFIDEQFSNYFIVIFNDLTETIKHQKQEVERQRNESLGSLAGSVAHEINNLLMPMTMAEDILEDELKDDCDPFAREQIKTISEYANQAKEIVQGILTFSRKETGNLKKVKLYDELNNSVHFIEGLLSSKTTLTVHDTDHKNVEAMVNQTEMKQIITNLCKNAEQAFDNNSGIIDISFDIVNPSKEEKTSLDVIANEFSVIHVADNGQGIPEENLKKIFDPLFTTKPVGQGTGLGLSVVIGIIRSWGGAITVDSVLGQGTTFNIYIPVYKDNDDFSDLMDLVNDLENKEPNS